MIAVLQRRRPSYGSLGVSMFPREIFASKRNGAFGCFPYRTIWFLEVGRCRSGGCVLHGVFSICVGLGHLC